LYLRYRTPSPGVRCYQITWQSLNPGIDPTDCFDWSGDGHWYGGGQARNMTWPAELGVVKLSPFITGDVNQQQWGNVLKRYFLNSKGIYFVCLFPSSSFSKISNFGETVLVSNWLEPTYLPYYGALCSAYSSTWKKISTSVVAIVYALR